MAVNVWLSESVLPPGVSSIVMVRGMGRALRHVTVYVLQSRKNDATYIFLAMSNGKSFPDIFSRDCTARLDYSNIWNELPVSLNTKTDVGQSTYRD